jgi:uncharacterized protein (TIGR02246 family)
MSAASEAARVVCELERAWNDADGQAYAASFTPDADFVDIRGARHKGQEAIADGHQAVFDSIYRGSTMEQEIVCVREIGKGCMVVHCASTLDAPCAPLVGTHHAIQTVVMRHESNRWQIVALHNSLVAS